MTARNGEDEKNPPLSPEDELIRDEFVRQFQERRLRPDAIHDPRKFVEAYRARRIAITQIAADPRVKIALLAAERLRFLALKADAHLAFLGDPRRATDRTDVIVLAPIFRELSELCAPFEGGMERQRDKLIVLIEWAARLLSKTTYEEADWKRVVSTLRFEVMGRFAAVDQHVSDNDLRLAIAAFVPNRFRPKGKAVLPKWDQLAALVRKARLADREFKAETIRTEYTRRRSKRRKQETAEREELRNQPLRQRTFTGPGAHAMEERIRSIEARALRKLRSRPTTKT